MALLIETKRLLAKRLKRASLRTIAAESNGQVDYEWLKKLHQGRIEDPGVARIERLKAALEAQVANQ